MSFYVSVNKQSQSTYVFSIQINVFANFQTEKLPKYSGSKMPIKDIILIVNFKSNKREKKPHLILLISQTLASTSPTLKETFSSEMARVRVERQR